MRVGSTSAHSQPRGPATEFAEAACAAASDLSTFLATALRCAAASTRARQCLLAVTLPSEAGLRVHHHGVRDDDLPYLLTASLAPCPDTSGGTRYFASIASDRGRFGRLAAVFAPEVVIHPSEKHILEGFAALITGVVEAHTARNELRVRDRCLSDLLDVSLAVSEDDSAERIAEHVAGAVPGITGFERATVFLWDEGDEVFRRACSRDFATSDANDPVAPGLSVHRDPELAARFLGDSRPRATHMDDTDPSMGRLLALAGYPAAVVQPIAARRALFGMILVSSAHSPVPSDSALQRDAALCARLSGVASIAATALYNSHLLLRVRHEADHDPVTGLANSRSFEEHVSRALSNAERHGHRMGVMFVDLDRFKSVNDMLGHSAGDDVLRAVGYRLRTVVRKGDLVARIGGDQFAIVLARLGEASEVDAVGAKLLTAFQRPIELFGRRMTVSVSVGGAIYPDHGRSYDELLHSADSAMHGIKNAGRNGFALFGSPS